MSAPASSPFPTALLIAPEDVTHIQLVDAVWAGDVAALKACLAVKGIDVNRLVKGPVVQHWFGRTEYHRPAVVALALEGNQDEKTKCEIAKLLIDAGARPDLHDTNGVTALHAGTYSAAVMKILLSAAPPPNVNIMDTDGNTPLHSHSASANGNAEQCQLLIDAKADVNAINNFGNTPLMQAVRHGKPEAIPVFLAAGADLSITNMLGDTAMTVAPTFQLAAEGNATCRELIHNHMHQAK